MYSFYEFLLTKLSYQSNIPLCNKECVNNIYISITPLLKLEESTVNGGYVLSVIWLLPDQGLVPSKFFFSSMTFSPRTVMHDVSRLPAEVEFKEVRCPTDSVSQPTRCGFFIG